MTVLYVAPEGRIQTQEWSQSFKLVPGDPSKIAHFGEAVASGSHCLTCALAFLVGLALTVLHLALTVLYVAVTVLLVAPERRIQAQEWSQSFKLVPGDPAEMAAVASGS